MGHKRHRVTSFVNLNLLIVCSEQMRTIDWLKPDSPALELLRKTLSQTHLMKSLRLLNHGQHTGTLESLHSLILAYAPKRLDFDPASYAARVQLALLDHNENVGREIQTGKTAIQYSTI